jgi:hypothetical protein
MKKKRYLTPHILILSIKTSCLMNNISGTSGADGLGMGGYTDDYGITEGGSRDAGFWDDED